MAADSRRLTNDQTSGQDTNADPPFRWMKAIRTSAIGSTVLGYVAVVVFVGGFFVWAMNAPLGSAAIAPGFIAAAGQNIAIQHPEGGPIDAIAVKEGEVVSRGDPLVELDDTQARVQHTRILAQLLDRHARAMRLTAERDGLEEITVSSDFPYREHERFEGALIEQIQEFAARRDRFGREEAILEQQVKALEKTIDGLTAELRSMDEQATIIDDEAARKLALLENGLTHRSEYTALLRSQAELTGQRGRVTAEIARTRTQTFEALEQIERLRSQRVEEAVVAASEVRLEIEDLHEQLRAQDDIIEQLTIRAPTDGIIVRKFINAPGRVVRAGEEILELLPTSPDLIVEAQIGLQDVDLVSIGQPARLRFSALNQRTTPELAGTVTFLSADRVIDPQSQIPHYVARLQIDDSALAIVDLENVYPGMPVETLISTDNRTFAEYLIKPITDSMRRAFREE